MNRDKKFEKWLREYKKKEQIFHVDERIKQHLFDSFCAGANHGREEVLRETIMKQINNSE